MGHIQIGFAYPGFEKRGRDPTDLRPEELNRMRRKFVKVAFGYCRTPSEVDALLDVL